MALIHVVIPVYNAVRFLRETVYSVLDQPCKDIDIVLVNDGSTDGSAQLCDEIAAKEGRVSVIHQENSGVSVARNAGIEYFLRNSSDGYVAFLDSDDLWYPDAITEEVADELRQMGQTDVFVFGCTNSNEDCSRYAVAKTYEKETFEGGNGVIWKVQRTFCANIYSLQMIREFRIRFKEKLKYSEDKIFALQNLFLARTVTFLPEILHIYRQNSTSAMSKIFTYTPIDYYTPIIDGWIDSDLFLNQYEPKTGKTTDAGFVLAGIYFMDMAMEHHMRWKHQDELENVKRHPYYHLFVNMKPECVNEKQYRNHNLLLKHPALYRIKYRAIGIVYFAARLVLRVKPISYLREKRKYPLVKLTGHT